MQVTLEKVEQDLFNRQIKHLLPTKNNNVDADSIGLSKNAVEALVSKKLVQRQHKFDVQAVRMMVRAKLKQIKYHQCQVAPKDRFLKNTEIVKNTKITNTL